MNTEKKPAKPVVTEALDNYALTLRLQDLATAISTGPRRSDVNVLTEALARNDARTEHLGQQVEELCQQLDAAQVQHVSGPQVYAAMTAIVAALSKTGIAKTRRNEQQGYAFRGIDELQNALAPLLAEHKLLVLPRVVGRTQSERVTAKGGVLFSVALDVEFDFVSSIDGSKHTVRTAGEAMDSGDKATNKAMSAAFKYALLQSFCVPLEGEGADIDTTTHDVKPTPPAGYAAYLGEAELAAAQGTDKLRAFAKASERALWAWLSTQDKAKLDALAAIAKEVKVADVAA